MKHTKKLLCVLLALAMMASLSVCAFAEGEDQPQKLAVKCVDTEGAVLRDFADDAIDLSTDGVIDDSYSRPVIENYTYKETKVNDEVVHHFTITHDEEGVLSLTATVVVGDALETRVLTGSETVLFVYEKNHVHSYDDGVVTTEPTCTEKGVKTFTCSCGDSYTEEVPALGHDYDAGKVTTEPTCTEKGVKTFTCKRCNDTKTEEIPALGHKFAHGRCERCDEIDPDFVPALSDDTNGRANWGSDYKVRSTALKKDFLSVEIDGKVLPASDYTVSEQDGNTIVTIKGDAIKKLKVGEHKVTINSVTGSATKSINVSDKPKTGDESMALWVALLAGSAICCGAVVFLTKKKFGAR